MSAIILVVEDEAIIARDIKTTLEGFGYIVPPPVATGAQALEAVFAHRPDLVLMDIRIHGGMDGIETAALIGKNAGTPIIYLTSYSDDTTLARAKLTGAYGYLLKPFQERDLRTAIEVALQKRELERQLSERERWFATTLKSIGDAVIATDVGQRITFMNVVAERVTGWTASDALGKQLGEVMRLVDQRTGAPLDSPLEHAFQEGFTVELSPALLSPKHGGQRSITDSAAPIVDDAGKTLGGVVVFRDVTEQRHIEERVARSDRLAAIGTMSAGMAHEINNPLAYVLSNVTFAIDELRELKDQLRAVPSPMGNALASRVADITEALGDAREGSERVHRLVHDLGKLGRFDTAETAVLELSEVLETSIRMMENIARHHARVRRRYGTTPFVEAAESQLGQVFINLLVNAAQAMGEGQVDTKQIFVATYADAAGRAVAEIRDTGPGIPQETLQRIFDPFFTTKDVGQGSGLGLSIAHSIVASLGGEISVESCVDKGTTFRVALPPARRRASTTALVARPESVRRGRVLAIDDEPAIGRVVSRVLQSEHDVSVVADAREALTRIASGEVFDVVFCDLMMPGMTGMDFFELIQKSSPEIAPRVVFVTGGASTQRTTEFLNQTSNATLSKPFDAVTLKRIVADYMGAPGAT
jgi:two-component system cell cycle sensor histidine kinase/response regulator CckA